MHGIINRGLQCFIQDIYGQPMWHDICAQANIPVQDFETMLSYDDKITEDIITTLCQKTGRERAAILEDFGTFIVTDHSSPAVLNLLRLGSETYEDFLFALQDWHLRGRIAVPDLGLPQFRVSSLSPSEFEVSSENSAKGFGAVFLGLLRTMADNYSTLVVIKHIHTSTSAPWTDVFTIKIHTANWSVASAKEVA